jgi:hypothetical protein
MIDIFQRAKFTLFRIVILVLSEFAFVLATITYLVFRNTYYARWLLLGTIAKTRFNLGMLAVSKRLAVELLNRADNYPDDWNYGNAIHRANTLLGRIAIREGDLPAAKRYLIASGQTPGSPQLDSFGPNMSLANDLLEAGEVSTVLEYFSHCSKFWEAEFSLLNQWRNDIHQGRKPRFGPHLHY